MSEVSVLFVAMNDISGKGGDSMATKDMLNAFVEDPRVSTRAVLPEPKGEMPLDMEALDVTYMPPLSGNSTVDYLRYSLGSFRPVREAMKKKKPDVVVTRMHHVILAPAFFCLFYGIPYVFLSRGTAYKSLRYSFILKRIFKFNLWIADEVYTASQEIKQDVDRMRRSKQSEAKVFPNGIDPEIFDPQPRPEAADSLGLDIEDQEFVVGFVGSMGPRHTVDVLIRSLAFLEDLSVKLLLIGDGPELEEYKKLTEELDVDDRVIFTGFVPHEEIDSYISAFDVGYGVTEQESATPIKCFEYLACERPVLAREIPDLGFISEKNLGLQVEDVDDQTVAGAIREFYGMTEERRLEMGERGRAYVLENHTWDALVDQVLGDLELI